MAFKVFGGSFDDKDIYCDYITQYSVYWAELYQEGRLMNGVRPVVIVSNEACNSHGDIVTVVPLTGVVKRLDMPTHSIVRTGSKQSTVLGEQITYINKSQLKGKYCDLSDFDIKAVQKCIQEQLKSEK